MRSGWCNHMVGHKIRSGAHSAFNSRVSTLTLHTVEQRHASCGQTCESTVVLAGRGGGRNLNFEGTARPRSASVATGVAGLSGARLPSRRPSRALPAAGPRT